MLTYKNWERKIVKELYILWNQSEKFLPCHGPEHHIRVWKMAQPFGLEKRADLDVLVASCLLHDVHSFYEAEPKDHEKRSARIAKKVLQKITFPAKKIPFVMTAIMDHRSSVRGKRSLEGDILKSFDKLDAFGPIGVYRIITPLSIRGYTAEDILGWALGQHRLEKKWQSIAFPELRKKYRARFFYTKRYFEALATALKYVPHRSRFTESKVHIGK